MTTTQVRPSTGTRVFATASVATTTTLTDSANGFTAADVGKTVTSTNVPATAKINSITDAGHAVMSQAATGTSGPQSCTLTPTYVNATFDAVTHVTKKNTDFGQLAAVVLAPGALSLALHAINAWHNNAGLGTASARAQKVAAAVGLQMQDV